MFVFALGQNGHCFCVVEIHACVMCDADTIGQLTCYMHYNNIIYGIYSMHLLHYLWFIVEKLGFCAKYIILSIVELFFTCVCVCMKATIIIGN